MFLSFVKLPLAFVSIYMSLILLSTKTNTDADRRYSTYFSLLSSIFLLFSAWNETKRSGAKIVIGKEKKAIRVGNGTVWNLVCAWSAATATGYLKLDLLKACANLPPRYQGSQTLSEKPGDVLYLTQVSHVHDRCEIASNHYIWILLALSFLWIGTVFSPKFSNANATQIRRREEREEEEEIKSSDEIKLEESMNLLERNDAEKTGMGEWSRFSLATLTGYLMFYVGPLRGVLSIPYALFVSTILTLASIIQVHRSKKAFTFSTQGRKDYIHLVALPPAGRNQMVENKFTVLKGMRMVCTVLAMTGMISVLKFYRDSSCNLHWHDYECKMTKHALWSYLTLTMLWGWSFWNTNIPTSLPFTASRAS